MIHEKLYKSDNLEAIDFHKYLLEFIAYIQQSLNAKEIEFDLECQDMMLTLHSAVPLGLIVNEIITNSLKHAFNESSSKKMKITINMSKDNDNKVELNIADNGVGVVISEINKNFGFKLIESLATYQLEASLKFYNMNGLAYYIQFDDIDSTDV